MRRNSSSLRWDLFLGAGLRQPGCDKRNSELIEVAESVGLTIFAPGRETRGTPDLSPAEIICQNRRAIEEACVFVLVPDDAGIGVYYELGLADALGKIIVGFSLSGVSGLGKVIEGRWELLPANRRAAGIDDFRTVLLSLRSTCTKIRNER
jgi:hypothetical protein